VKKQQELEKLGLFDPQEYFKGPVIPSLSGHFLDFERKIDGKKRIFLMIF